MRMLRFVIAFGIAWGMQAGVSFAEDDWLDRLSGPGAFWGTWLDYRFACFSSPNVAGTTETVFTFLKPSDRTAVMWWRPIKLGQRPDFTNTANRKAAAAYECKRDVPHDFLIVSYRFNQSYSNEVVPRNNDGEEARVRINGFEVGHVRRLKHGWGLRNTVGINRFSGVQFNTFWKGSNTIAFEFAPYAAAPAAEQEYRAQRIKFVMGATILYGDFDSSAFCNRTASNPQCARVTPRHYGTEVIPKVSFVINPALW
jgi:hypothetical protein